MNSGTVCTVIAEHNIDFKKCKEHIKNEKNPVIKTLLHLFAPFLPAEIA